jgi:hypothetical protein
MHKLILLVGLLFFFGCSRQSEKAPVPVVVEEKPKVNVPEFNADSAYEFVKKQVAFGPRVPNTDAHVKCGDYLVSQMKNFCDTVYVQSGILKAFDGTPLRFRNIIGVINPEAKSRVLLFAHWDTRPWSDQDMKDEKKPSLGADDGASGVGTLMELARIMHLQRPSIGIDFAFYDAEDWGKEGGGPESEDSYALGTQFWAKQTHIPGYTAKYGILLDMTGARNAQFRWEGNSRQYAGFVLDKVWSTAANNGYSQYFLSEDGGWVIDDHVYINKINIPSIDIIGSDITSRSGFPKHWHTHADNMDVIDRNTLKAVGQTLTAVLYLED